MASNDPKADLQAYLRDGRDALVTKLDGLSAWDARRPGTPTASNLLGIVKHVAWVQAGYFGSTFDRPFPGTPPWEVEGGSMDDDMWARADESREAILDLVRRSSEHADATISALPLDAVGLVPWWQPGRQEVTLHRVLVHVTTEVHRHAGQADILRELIDGTAGLRTPGDNLPERDAAAWREYYGRVERAARAAAG